MATAIIFLSILCGVGLGSSAAEFGDYGGGFTAVKISLFTAGIIVCTLISTGVIS